MQFQIGSEKEFYSFVDSITKEDNVGILTHTDLDGISSAIFLEKIIESKNIKPKFIEFEDYKNNILKELILKINKEKITKLFISDLNIDSLALEDFEKLRKKIDVFLVDHHPTNPMLKDYKNIIKGKSADCAAFILYNLGLKYFKEDFRPLVSATMISEFSFNDENNFLFIKNIYPQISKEKISESIPGKLSMEINYGLIYFSNDTKKIHDLILENDFKKLEKSYEIISKEIEKEERLFWDDAEFIEEKNIYYYYFKPKHHLKSIISTTLSLKKPDCSFIIINPDDNDSKYLSISARNQSGNNDMNQLLKKTVQDLKNSNAGGHKKASGARILKKDLTKFKENLLR